MEQTGELVLVFLVLALVLGAATRRLLRDTPVPYTVALLVIGLGLGLAERLHWLGGPLHAWGEAVRGAGEVNPHLILFVFLPTLIFESAFAMDVHTFRRTFGQVVLLAVPGLLVSTVVIGAAARWFFPWDWGWPAALMFGALLSATDPVAVVALLRELGASKRLATVIEGESLLNDGTGIVVFSALFGVVVAASGWSVGEAALEFTRVSAGGLLVGALLGAAAIAWIGRVFNDMLVEITLTIAAAYLAFLAAEGALHVSGVLAVVTLGLLFAGVGRTRISPEVGHFLHQFWSLAAYLANTLIFILVGVVIALRTDWGDAEAWGMLALVYAAIHVARLAAVGVLYPFLRAIGYGLGGRDAVVLTWGGLRGAVGLALALVVAQDPRVPAALGDQVLFLTAGIVVLTLLVNGSTMRPLIAWLGMDRLSPAKRAALAAAAQRVDRELDASVAALQQDPFLRGADWGRVRTTAARGYRGAEAFAAEDAAHVQEVRGRLLVAAKRSYWRQFEEGTLSAAAVRRLIEAADLALDHEAALDRLDDLRPAWRLPAALERLNAIPAAETLARVLYFERVAAGYEVARGYVVAQEEAARLLDAVTGDAAVRERMRGELEHGRREVLTYLSALRGSFPEVSHAIETRIALRTALNQERTVIEQLVEEGVLDESEAGKWIEEVERDMKQTVRQRLRIRLPAKRDLLREIPWLRGLAPAVFDRVASIAHERVFHAGEALVR